MGKDSVAAGSQAALWIGVGIAAIGVVLARFPPHKIESPEG